jgi:L-threonylcarbamoyladenylate synthase
MIHVESLLAVTSAELGDADHADQVLKSPGMLQKHYAPRAKVVILSWHNETELFQKLAKRPEELSSIHVLAHSYIPSGSRLGGVGVIPHDPEAFARALYAELHRCDELNARLIVVEQVPTAPAWSGIADRLQRAAS